VRSGRKLTRRPSFGLTFGSKTEIGIGARSETLPTDRECGCYARTGRKCSRVQSTCLGDEMENHRSDSYERSFRRHNKQMVG
jgi:hypothetical protein